jgi:VanZ family protein
LLTWAAALGYLSLASSVRAPSGLLGWDKSNHFAAYAVLAVLLIRSLMIWHAPSVRLLTVAWLSCTAYGLLLEGLQGMMGAGRQWEIGDLLANALGALTACVVFCLIVGRSSLANDR